MMKRLYPGDVCVVVKNIKRRAAMRRVHVTGEIAVVLMETQCYGESRKLHCETGGDNTYQFTYRELEYMSAIR